MENATLLDCLRSLQASSAEMTKKQEEEELKKLQYESEMEDSLQSITNYQEKNRELLIEIESFEYRELAQPIIATTIGIDVIKSKSAEMDSLLRIACADGFTKSALQSLEGEIRQVERAKSELQEAITVSEKAAAIEEQEAESNKKTYDAAMIDLEEAKAFKSASEKRLATSRTKARELIAEVKSLKEKQQMLITSASESHRSMIANRMRVDALTKQLKEREDRYRNLMKELQ